MAIVGNRIDQVEIPHEKGNYIHLRALSGLELEDAQEIRSTKSLKRWAELGTETVNSLRNNNSEEAMAQAAQAALNKDPKLDYDWQFIIDKAVVGWSGPDYDSIECNSDNKKMLDKATREWIIDEIVKRNVITEGESQTSEGYSVEA